MVGKVLIIRMIEQLFTILPIVFDIIGNLKLSKFKSLMNSHKRRRRNTSFT